MYLLSRKIIIFEHYLMSICVCVLCICTQVYMCGSCWTSYSITLHLIFGDRVCLSIETPEQHFLWATGTHEATWTTNLTRLTG